MIVLALDLGTRLGWALGADGMLASGVEDLAPQRMRRFESSGMKWLRLRGVLDKLHGQVPGGVSLVVLEEVRRHLGVDAAHAYGGALAVVSAWCEERKVPMTSTPVATIKKHATGKGNAKKEAMIEAAKARGWLPADDNEADAQWILDHALSGGAA